ncbi:MAG: DnaB-like helicase C-terminal domain-containing protein [Gemmatimonadota bacterium]|nr:DnaB-like helicase C-terminal domain-containing protein [Gemmatimonadota bacterium]MDH4351621.1 DnaB-like helicase C-terminal domain-containing protein [Gemmatimonadota bacterium]
MPDSHRLERRSLQNIIQRVDGQASGALPPDTVPTGFASVDRQLGGGLRRRDLVVLGGDVGSGKSAFALAVALRVAHAGFPVVFCSGEMDEDRLVERALAFQGKVRIDDLRAATVSEEQRAAIGAAALRLRDLPITFLPLVGRQFDEALEPAWPHGPALLVVDYLQLLPPTALRQTRDEDASESLRALKGVALERQIACLVVAQLPEHRPERDDPRPTLDDFGALGAVKQHADVVLSLYREEMYNPGGGVEGATELIVGKNRNGPTGFVDLYFYRPWLRFEDMLDPT